MKKFLLLVALVSSSVHAGVVMIGRSPVIVGGVSMRNSCEVQYANCLGNDQELTPERMQLLIQETLKKKHVPKPENTIVEKPSKPYVVPPKELTKEQKVLQENLNKVNILGK